MNVKLKVLRKVLEEAIANIDAGNSNLLILLMQNLLNL